MTTNNEPENNGHLPQTHTHEEKDTLHENLPQTTELSPEEELRKWLEDPDVIKATALVRENEEMFLQTKKEQISLLVNKYMQSKVLNALKKENFMDMTMQKFKEALDQASPRMILSIFEKLSESTQVDFQQLFGAAVDNKKGGGATPLINLNINTPSQGGDGSPMAEEESFGNQDSAMRAMRSFAKIYENLISNVREAEFETIDAEVEAKSNDKKVP